METVQDKHEGVAVVWKSASISDFKTTWWNSILVCKYFEPLSYICYLFFFFFLNLMFSVLPELSFCGILFPVNILLSAELWEFYWAFLKRRYLKLKNKLSSKTLTLEFVQCVFNSFCVSGSVILLSNLSSHWRLSEALSSTSYTSSCVQAAQGAGRRICHLWKVPVSFICNVSVTCGSVVTGLVRYLFWGSVCES